jgi:hypothetical protein
MAGVVTNEFAVPALDAPATQLGAIAAGPDGALWVTESRSGKIARITTGGALSEYTLPTAGGGPTGIATGPTEPCGSASASRGQWAESRPTRHPTPCRPGLRGRPARRSGRPGRPGGGGVPGAPCTPTRRPQAQGALCDHGAGGGGPPGQARPRTDADCRQADRPPGRGATLVWNGRLGRRRARRGRYVLTVRATRDGRTASSRLRVRLR